MRCLPILCEMNARSNDHTVHHVHRSSPRTNNPYTRLDDGNNEMAEVGSSTNLISRPADGPRRSMSGFYDEVIVHSPVVCSH